MPQWLQADVAILGEPSDGVIEAGCQGTLRVVVRTTGTRAHSARSWLGDNAIHKLHGVLARLSEYRARDVDIDGCVYREGLSAVRVDGEWRAMSFRRRIRDGELPLRPDRRRPRRWTTCARCSTAWT